MSGGDENDTRGATLTVDPFTSVHYVFGMLLGEEDFRADQGYHRGKGWLHNAWLHGPGVVWGFDVKYRTERRNGVEVPRELEVSPGLALDGAGRELHLGETMCVVLGDWYNAHRAELGAVSEEEGLTLHLVARFRACLGRDVPAIMEPCQGAAADTAPSRAYEKVSLELKPGAAPTPTVKYRRLRVLLGLLDPAPTPTDANDTAGAEQAAEDQKAATRRQDVLAVTPAAARGAALMKAFREMSALDVRDLKPAEGVLTPEGDDAEVVLAELRGLRFEQAGSTWRVAEAGALDKTVAPAHVATSVMQDLVCGLITVGG